MIPICPRLKAEDARMLTRICFALDAQVPSAYSSPLAALVAVTTDPGDHTLLKCIESFSSRARLMPVGRYPFIPVHTPESIPDKMRSHGIRYRFDGDIVVLAPPHELGKYWRAVKANHPPGTRVLASEIPHYFTKDSWTSLDAARNAVWREACALYEYMTRNLISRADGDTFIRFMEKHLQGERCGAA